MMDDLDVVVIEKKTALERYGKSDLSEEFEDYISRDVQGKEQLHEAHKTHVKSREALFRALKALKLRFVALNLDDLRACDLSFFQPGAAQSGLQTARRLVISLGGDGTLLHASHYVGGETTLFGINSCPAHSVGHLCAADPQTMTAMLENLLKNPDAPTQLLQRLQVVLPHVTFPLALNDVFMGHVHPAATSRYQISLCDLDGKVKSSEKQLSSGLWVSTAAGSTAAIGSYGFLPEPLTSSRVLVATREPYTYQGKSFHLNHFLFDGRSQYLSLFSRMRNGLVSVDGQDSCAQFGFGEIIQISSPPQGVLRLVAPGHLV